MEAKVYAVNEVSLSFTGSMPPFAVIGARGQVPSSGWSRGHLVPRIYLTPPSDGIWDFDFVATAPAGIALQVLSPIVSAPFVAEVPSWLKGVRVHSSTNTATGIVAAAPEAAAREMRASVLASAGGPDVFPWASMLRDGSDYWPWALQQLGGVDILPWYRATSGGVDGWPWMLAEGEGVDTGASGTDQRIPAPVLKTPLSDILGFSIRVHRESDPVTEDFRQDRINFVVAEDKPIIVRIYVG